MTTPTPETLDSQVVLITGASRGLGAAIARAFVREGARVVVNHLTTDPADLVAELGKNAVALRADVTDSAQVEAMLAAAAEHFGQPVTTVINNALPSFTFNGDARPRADVIGWAAMDQQLGAVRAALHTVQAALPAMRAARSGRVVNIGTNLVQNPVVPYHDYTAAKAALLGLTRTLAAELGPDGVRVNMVSGGLLRTTDASAATPDAVFDLIAGSTPLRSVTTPEEMADAVVFLASPWSRAMTGQNLVVDGGLVMS